MHFPPDQDRAKPHRAATPRLDLATRCAKPREHHQSSRSLATAFLPQWRGARNACKIWSNCIRTHVYYQVASSDATVPRSCCRQYISTTKLPVLKPAPRPHYICTTKRQRLPSTYICTTKWPVLTPQLPEASAKSASSIQFSSHLPQAASRTTFVLSSEQFCTILYHKWPILMPQLAGVSSHSIFSLPRSHLQLRTLDPS